MNISSDERQVLASKLRTPKNHALEDFGLYFYDPSNDKVELIKGGSDIPVTIQNLQQYIDLVLDSTFHQSVRLQIGAFKKGFNSVFPLSTLSIFTPVSEIEKLYCGEQASDWTDKHKLSQEILATHGITKTSQPFKDFIRYIAEMDQTNRAAFI